MWLHIENQQLLFIFSYNNRAGRIGPAALVLAGPVFSQGKSKIPFLQKTTNKQSASVILGLIRLITLDRKGISRGARLSAAHAFRSLLCSKVLCYAKAK